MVAPGFPLPDSRKRLDSTRPGSRLQSTLRYYRVDRRDISLLRFILEAYEGVATLTTVDAQLGVVMVRIAPGHERLVTELLDVLCANRDIRLEPLPDPPSTAPGEK